MRVRTGHGRFPVKGGPPAWTIILRAQEAAAPSLWTELAPPWTRRDRFATRPRPCVGRIAQLVEQLTLNQRVPGSNPGAPTKISPQNLDNLHGGRRDLTPP